MCRELEVSEAGYYKWLKRLDKPYKHEALLGLIMNIHSENPDYGAYGIYLYLKHYHAYEGSASKVDYLYMKHNVRCKTKRKYPNGITKADKNAQVNENLLKQDFSASIPNTK